MKLTRQITKGEELVKPEVELQIKQLKKELANEKKKVNYLEEELSKSEKSFQTVAENAPDVICRFDKNFHHLYVNPALEKSTGAPRTAFIGRTPHEAGLPTLFADLWVDTIATVFKTGEPTSLEFSFPTPVGEKYFQALVVPEYSPEENQVETVLSITRDITEMKQAQKEKDEFLGIVSHELKTPVTSLKAFTQVMQNKFVNAKDYSNVDQFKKMSNQLDKLMILINDLLDLTKIQGGKLQFNEKLFDFDNLVNETIEEVQQTTQDHSIILQGSTKKKLFADADRTRQVLINLLSNAIKYSPHAKEIIVQLSSSKEEIWCGVKDFGLGISKEHQEKIFERFFRGGTKDQLFPGLGLGLYITKEIIERQGGKIWVESEEGKGSLFCFSLPIRSLSNK